MSAAALADAGPPAFCARHRRRQAAVENLARRNRSEAWGKAYSSLANKAEFTEPEFVRDLTGNYLSLRTYATVENFEVRPLHESADDAEIQLKMHWSTVVGTFVDTVTCTS